VVPLFKVEEWIGEIDDVLVAVDVGHGGKSKRIRGRAERRRVSTEDDGDNQGQTTNLYI